MSEFLPMPASRGTGVALLAKIGVIGLGLVAAICLASAWRSEPILHDALTLVQTKPGWAILAIVLLMVAHNVVPIPAEAIAIAAGAILGPFLGSLAVWCGAMLGAAGAFWVSRIWGKPLIRSILPKRYVDRMDRMALLCTWPSLLGLRMIPVVSFNLVNYSAGLTSVPWTMFLWTTAIGIIPVTLISVGVGASLLEFRMEYLVICLALLVVFALACRRFQQ